VCPHSALKNTKQQQQTNFFFGQKKRMKRKLFVNSRKKGIKEKEKN